MPRPISIIAFNSNLGLIEPGPGKEPGVKKLPAWLRKHGFYEMIDPQHETGLDAPAYSMYLDPVTDVRNADAIIDYAKRQAEIISPVILNKNFALVLGGDCSILIGNGFALKKMGDYGLFFIDGHTDFMWPELSSTHAAAGMDLAIVTGNAHNKLSNIENTGPYFKEENVWCVGNREFDENYVNTIKNSHVHYYDLKELRKEGIKKCVDDFLNFLSVKKPDGFWVHLDADVLDPQIMPAVDSPDPGGLSYFELISLLEDLLAHPLCTGLEITILDPDLDPEGKYVSEFIFHIGNIIKKAVE